MKNNNNNNNSNNMNNNNEPLMNDENSRFTLYPIKYDDIWQLYKKQVASFWIAEEVDLSQDVNDWNNKLTDDERWFIKNILAFFAGSDGIVNLNLTERFMNDVKLLEAVMTYSFQSTMENIHSEMYSLMIDTYIKDPVEKDKLLNAITTIPCVGKKANWALKWINNVDSFSKRLIAFAIVEGIFFSGSFCAIYWLRTRNLLPGLTLSNEFIARDEGMHCEFACLLYNKYLNNKLKFEDIVPIFIEAVEIETEFICESLPCKLIGMNSELMTQYIKYVADKLLVQLGYPKIYYKNNPFPFMDQMSVDGKTNFFESRVSQYQKSAVNKKGTKLTSFTISEDF